MSICVTSLCVFHIIYQAIIIAKTKMWRLIMEMDAKKNHCPDIDIDGVISAGKQFDLDITLPDVYRKKY